MQAKLRYSKRNGTARTRPIVLLHGLGNNYQSWQFVLDMLHPKQLDVYALDLLGFGDADKPPTSTYNLDAHATAVIEFLDSKQLSDVVLVGHSMGCLVAIHIAHVRPDLAHKLILLGPPLYDVLPVNHSKKRSWFRRKVGLYFTIFEYLQRNPGLTTTAADFVDTFLPLVKGMEITDQTWRAFSRSLQNTIMTTQSYQELVQLKTPSICYYGLLDVFILRRPIAKAHRKNRRYVKKRTVLGPHEITPLQGRKIARVISKAAR